MFKVGHSFARTVTFDEPAIRAFARAAGDENPLHHDAAYAAASRFGGIIASGTHHGALMMGLVATDLAFRKPVPAGMTMRLEWTVTELEPAPRLGGTIAHLTGRMTEVATGALVLTATSKCLLMGGPVSAPTTAAASRR